MCRKLFSALGLSLIAVALVAAPVAAQQGRGRGGFGRQQSLMTLAGNEAVQKDIGLTDTSKVQALAGEYREAITQEMSGIDFQGLRDLPEAERAAKMRELTAKSEAASKKVNATFEPKLKELLSAEQFKRLGEIRVQAIGVAALTDAAVAKELGLSEEQTKKIADIQAEGTKATQGLFGGGGNIQEAMAKIREINEQTLTKATDVLSADQKGKFTALKGKPFDLTQLGGRGGGRGKQK